MKMAEEFNTEAKSEDASYFEKTFSEVKEIKDKNLNSDKWLDTVATIDNIDDQKSFIDITKNIKASPATLKNNYLNKKSPAHHKTSALKPFRQFQFEY